MGNYNYCPNCGAKQSGNPKFCFECGNDLSGNVIEPSGTLNVEIAYPHFETAIDTLIRKSGILIITINKEKIVLTKNPESFKLKVSIDESSLNEKNTLNIKSLSFRKAGNSMEKDYILNYTDKVINDIVHDLSCLFQIETGIEFEHKQFAENEIPSKNSEPILSSDEGQTNNSEISVDKKNRKLDPLTKVIIIGLLIIVGLLFGRNLKEKTSAVEKSHHNNSNVDYSSVNQPVSGNYDTSNEDKRDMGRLVGVWPDNELAKSAGFSAGYKFVLSDEGKLYFSTCDLTEETLEIGAKSELITISELVWDGKEYVDMHLPDQRFRINKSGDLIISDQLGKIGVFVKSFIDPTVLKF